MTSLWAGLGWVFRWNKPVNFRFPGLLQLGDLGRILAADLVVPERGRQRFKCHPRISHDGNGGDLIGVELRRVDVDEPYLWVLEGGHGGRGEIGIAGADADDEVGVASQTVRSQVAGSADRAYALRVVVGQ